MDTKNKKSKMKTSAQHIKTQKTSVIFRCCHSSEDLLASRRISKRLFSL